MLEAWVTSRRRTLTLVFLVISCASALAAIVVGIDDNPPGIVLAFCAIAALVFAFVHPWRTARQFRRLLFASVLGLVVFAILHNVFEALGAKAATASALQSVLQGLSVATFLLAVLFCPVAILIGAVGAIVTFVLNRRRPGQDREGVA